MANNCINIKDFDVKSNQSFLFDNNIWMFLYCPIANYNAKKQASISKLFETILSRDCSIIVNNLILSEFCNAYLRLDYNLWKDEASNLGKSFKKDYFLTERSRDTREEISSIVENKILKFSDKYPDSFNALNFGNIWTYYKEIDYNDSMIYEQCKITSGFLFQMMMIFQLSMKLKL